jgi:hypothetical protein
MCTSRGECRSSGNGRLRKVSGECWLGFGGQGFRVRHGWGHCLHSDGACGSGIQFIGWSEARGCCRWRRPWNRRSFLNLQRGRAVREQCPVGIRDGGSDRMCGGNRGSGSRGVGGNLGRRRRCAGILMQEHDGHDERCEAGRSTEPREPGAQPCRSTLRRGGCWRFPFGNGHRRRVDNLPALFTSGQMRQHVFTLAGQESTLGKRGEHVRIGVRAGLLAERQFVEQRIGLSGLHVVDRSSFLTYRTSLRRVLAAIPRSR